MTFEDKYTIEPVPQHVARIIQRTPDSLFDQSKVPEKLWQTLFQYQKKGIEHALNKFGGRCLLADDMGLGKTRQALAFIGHCKQPDNRVLVACPSYLRYHWQQSIQDWLDMESQLVKKGNEPVEGDIVIVSYDMLHKLDIPTGIFDIIVCDESHYVKSRKTKRTKI
jgi:SWI/SNF-related matrix-associated actin-dependent regulator 1 of chromatin subfamily A